jgi:hypothetical protein
MLSWAPGVVKFSDVVILIYIVFFLPETTSLGAGKEGERDKLEHYECFIGQV